MSDSTDGGADAVRLINGHLVRARKPPILPNSFLNSVPLFTGITQSKRMPLLPL